MAEAPDGREPSQSNKLPEPEQHGSVNLAVQHTRPFPHGMMYAQGTMAVSQTSKRIAGGDEYTIVARTRADRGVFPLRIGAIALVNCAGLCAEAEAVCQAGVGAFAAGFTNSTAAAIAVTAKRPRWRSGGTGGVEACLMRGVCKRDHGDCDDG
jgi:hypothetical protein